MSPEFAGRRVLVTGGSGFIGRHVVADLRDAGAAVRIVDLKEHPDPSVDLVQGDIADREVLERAFDGGFDGVVHLAAVTSVLRSMDTRSSPSERTSKERTRCWRAPAPPA